MGEVLLAETIGRLRVLRLNRPERKNALNGALFRAITDEVLTAAHDDEVWALVITGNGDAFCSGLDLDDVRGPDDPEPRDEDAAEDDDDQSGNFAMLLRVECAKPVIAGVNGVAVGIGVSLAMAADMRIAAPSARFHPGYAAGRDVTRRWRDVDGHAGARLRGGDAVLPRAADDRNGRGATHRPGR